MNGVGGWRHPGPIVSLLKTNEGRVREGSPANHLISPSHLSSYGARLLIRDEISAKASPPMTANNGERCQGSAPFPPDKEAATEEHYPPHLVSSPPIIPIRELHTTIWSGAPPPNFGLSFLLPTPQHPQFTQQRRRHVLVTFTTCF